MSNPAYHFRVYYYDIKCRMLKWVRVWQNKGKFRSNNPLFLFVLCPPYAGSTLMQEILSTSPNVSPNNIFGTREGLGLPEVRALFDYRELWNKDYSMPWQSIRREWESYWNLSKPILLEKSPSNLLHVLDLIQNFAPAYFVVMTRNPYAHCESLIRRDKQSIPEAAKFVLSCLRKQKENLEICQKSLLIRYEDLVQNPQEVFKRLLSFLPSLEKLDDNRVFQAHNFQNQKLPITNLNQIKIARLNKEQIRKINRILESDLEILHHFGYFLQDD